MKFPFIINLFLLNIYGKDIYSNDKNNKYDEIMNTFWEVYFSYNNPLIGFGINYNIYDLLNNKENNKKFIPTHSLVKSLVEDLWGGQIVSNILNNIFNTYLRFYDVTKLISSEKNDQYNKKKKIYMESMALFLDSNLETMDNEEFFSFIDELIKEFNNDDKIYLYISIVANKSDGLLKIYNETQKNASILNYINLCLFYPLLQIEYQGNFHELLSYKTSYPGRYNYGIIHHYFNTNTKNSPYTFGGRWVLTEKFNEKNIKDLSLKNFIKYEDKSFLQNNFSSFPKLLKQLIILYLLKKFIDEKNIKEYKKQMYDLLCKIFNDYCYQEWMQILQKEFQEKNKQTHQKQ